MANTYTAIYVHVVFAVKYRQGVISPLWRENLYTYIGGVIRNQQNRLIAIGGTKDHVHILLAMPPTMSISDAVRDIKSSSAHYINTNRYMPCRFAWQKGYSAFTYAHSQIDAVAAYINHQPEHHENMTLEEEIERMLKRFDVRFDKRYILTEPI